MKIVINTKVWKSEEWDVIPTTIELIDEDCNPRIEFENDDRIIQFELSELEEAITTLKNWKEKFKS
ncbi:MAG: hypothetical protein IM535_05080 [Pseudanabaena sp. M38BS1SP1A06MG]|nr:hypothetical protein [Pseudanabaena sp. M53BS1SP1A06MG]MCA6591486.1 hypothetical protein [Pseudanabaena sp. M38BS1SP1A06MG]